MAALTRVQHPTASPGTARRGQGPPVYFRRATDTVASDLRRPSWWPVSVFENTRRTLVTLLRADHLEFDPPLKVLARRALGRRIERVELRATGVPIEQTDVKIDQLDVVAHDVALGLNRKGPTVTVGSAAFSALLTQEQLTQLVPLPTGVSRLTITGRGITFHTVAGIPIYTSVTLEEGNRLHVAPGAPAKVPLLDLIGIDIALPQLPVGGGLEQLTRFGLTFDLPKLPANAQIEQIEPREGELLISGSLDLMPQPAELP